MVTAQEAKQIAQAYNNRPDPKLEQTVERIVALAKTGCYELEQMCMTDQLRYNLLSLGYRIEHCGLSEKWTIKW